MYYILEINEKIFNIYNNLNSAIVHLFKLNECKLNCVIKELTDGCITSLFYIKNNKILCTSLENNNLIEEEYTNLPFEIIYMKQNIPINSKSNQPTNLNTNLETNQVINNSSDINVKLPINTEIIITSEESDVDIEELKRKIDQLNRLKDLEINDLENLNKDFHEQENKIIAEKFSVDAEKNKLKLDKGKWEEFKNIFNADKKIYKIMKEQLDNEDIDEIPELFEKKYPIFKVLDENDLLDIPSDIYEYIKLLPEDDSVYIPKNIALKGLFNDDNGISSISLTELKDNYKNYESVIETDDES
jgi:hypothetical protein